MSLSGKLQDVPLADLLQFIHLGRRTGTLRLSRLDERAQLGFVRGRLLTASAPQWLKLDRSLSRVAQGAAVLESMARALRGLLLWSTGEFQFLPGRVPHVDELGLDLRSLLPGVELDAEQLLLDAARLQDEAQHPTDPYGSYRRAG